MSEALFRQVADPRAFATAPETMVRLSWTEAFGIPAAEVDAIRLAALQLRFAELLDRIPVLKRLADWQRIRTITSLEDGAFLLFRHSDYKSYPIGYLEKSRFDRLTQWLDGLTVHDLSSIDASGIESIDDWIALLERKTDLRIIHSSGTSGKLSFLPRSESEIPINVLGMCKNFEGYGSESHADVMQHIDRMVSVFPGHRHGAYAAQRNLDGLVKYAYDGNENMVAAFHPGRLSGDAASLAGRLRAAEARGEGPLELTPTLAKRREEFAKHRRDTPERLRKGLMEIEGRLRGCRVISTAAWAPYYDLAVEAAKLGIFNLFSPDSIICMAGGLKGRTLPADYAEVIKRFLGTGELRTAYGMSEVIALFPACPQGNYHLSPWVIPYVLDPDSGAPYPRTGVHTGRFGVMDLTVNTHWGGFLTGDEVTLYWGDSTPCRCGRIGSYLDQNISRYSENRGGDDKITCAGAPDAMNNALPLIAES